MAGLSPLHNPGALPTLLRWQWQAYWRRILRGGTAARSNLVVLALMGAAGFARYVTFLRGIRPNDTGVMELLIAGLMLVCLLPGWDAAKLALGSREMIRFPLSAGTRFGLRVISRFVAPVSWILLAACAGGLWPVLKLPQPVPAALAFLLLLFAAFGFGVALADLAQTAQGARVIRLLWLMAAGAVSIAWFSGVRQLPPLPGNLVIRAGTGEWLAVAGALLLAALGFFAALRTFLWMLRRSPPQEGSGQHRSALPVTLFSRELRLAARLAEVRTVWAIALALCLYLATAAHPEPDALRVMFGVLSFLVLGAALNNFGFDGAPGLDRFLLWPVAALRIVAAKNRAFALVTCGPAIPLALLSTWRFGWREGAANLLEAAAIEFALLAWGNMASVRHPESTASASGGNLFDQLAGMVAIALPTATAIGLLRSNANLAPLYLAGLTLLWGLAYAASLRWTARYFASNYESMRQRLS